MGSACPRPKKRIGACTGLTSTLRRSSSGYSCAIFLRQLLRLRRRRPFSRPSSRCHCSQPLDYERKQFVRWRLTTWYGCCGRRWSTLVLPDRRSREPVHRRCTGAKRRDGLPKSWIGESGYFLRRSGFACLRKMFELTMKVPSIAKAQVQILSEGVVERVTECDPLLADSLPVLRFTKAQIRGGPPESGAFGVHDLRCGA